MRNVASIIGILCAVAVSSAAKASDYNGQGNELGERLERLERDISILQQQFYQTPGESHAPANRPVPGDTTATQSAAVDAQFAEFEERMRVLNGKIEQLEFNISKVSEKLDKIATDSDFRFGEIEKKLGEDSTSRGSDQAEQLPASQKNKNANHNLGTLPVKKDGPAQVALSTDKGDEEDTKENKDSSEKTTKEPVEKAKKSAMQVQYDRAYALHKEGKYAEAQKAFGKFIESYPKQQLTGAAYYWMGESYYNQKDYNKAALQYLYSYKHFPKGTKAPDSLLKTGLSLAKAGKKKEACKPLLKLEKEYPDAASSVTKRAEQEMKRLGCE